MTASLGPLLLAILSLALILGGAFLTWRDFRSKRGVQAVPTGDPRAEAAAVVRTDRIATARTAAEPTRSQPRSEPHPTRRIAEPPVRQPDRGDDANARTADAAAVTIVKREAQASRPAAPSGTGSATAVAMPAPGQPFTDLRTAVAAILTETSDGADTDAEGQRWPSVEARWVHIEREIDRAVATFNTALAPVGLDIGKSGEVGWSFKNRGFGSYRRIAIGGRSLGWLRAETNQEHQLICKVRAHAADHALLNASALIPATRLDDTQIVDLLARVLRPSGEYAAWIAPKDRPSPASDDMEGQGWEIATLARDALAIASGALREADATLSETRVPAWDPESAVHRWRLAVAVGPTRVADITVLLIKRSLEVVSQPADAARTELGRKRRLDLDGLTAHALAEAIAATAWPAVADRLERTPT